jgi:hypothetical protein
MSGKSNYMMVEIKLNKRRWYHTKFLILINLIKTFNGPIFVDLLNIW